LIVVDTNVAAYLLIQSVNSPAAIAVRRKDSVWYAPHLWRSELRNVLIPYVRRQIVTLEKAVNVMEEAELLINTSSVDSRRVIELAMNSNCSAYDSEFVTLAERLDVHLVTSDKKIRAAFPDIAVSMEAFVA